MMPSIKSAVFLPPEIEKTANFELSKDVSKWNDEIMNQFFEQIDYLPREVNTDIVINSVDENEGYAKGSVVAWFNDKKVNFPIIVKDYELSPFDVFVYNKDEVPEYYPANTNNLKRVLLAEKVGKLENRYDATIAQELKTPGWIAPKVSIPLYDMPEGALEPPYSKMSSLRIKDEDIQKLAIQMEAQPDVMQSFVDNTGDLITNVLNLKDNNKVTIPDDHKNGILDTNNIVDAKRALTVIDSEFMDTSTLIPVTAPMVAELRMFEYPSMEDFLESGKDISDRYLASKNGRPLVGVVIDYKESGEGCVCMPCGIGSDTVDENGKPKLIKTPRPQVFISMDGQYYSINNDYDKSGICFYGSKVLNTPGAIEKVIKNISEKTLDYFINTNRLNRNSGADKVFSPIKEKDEGIKDGYYDQMESRWSQQSDVFILYGAGDAWECMKFYGNFKKKSVNNTNIYTSQDLAIIPAKVGSVQKVGSVEDPMFKMIVGKAKEIYLIPESSIIVNSKFMRRLNNEDFLRPDKKIQQAYELASINKVSMWVDGDGYKITGKPVEPLQKIAGFNNSTIYKTSEVATVLSILGMDKAASRNAMITAISKAASDAGPITIYGVRDDYVKSDAMDGVEKNARVKKIWSDIAYGLRKDLVKEASLLDDPEAVDAVLKLNFINSENLGAYIDSIGEMKKIIGKLCSMLIASRMGLTELPEDSLKASLEGLDEVVKGLEDVKLAIGQ